LSTLFFFAGVMILQELTPFYTLLKNKSGWLRFLVNYSENKG